MHLSWDRITTPTSQVWARSCESEAGGRIHEIVDAPLNLLVHKSSKLWATARRGECLRRWSFSLSTLDGEGATLNSVPGQCERAGWWPVSSRLVVMGQGGIFPPPPSCRCRPDALAFSVWHNCCNIAITLIIPFHQKRNPTLSGRLFPSSAVSERGSVDGRVNGARTLSRNLYRH